MNTMNIYALSGHRVRLATFEAGYDHDRAKARQYLRLGREYTVDRTVVDSWSTTVYLKEVPNVSFNSVLFEDVEPQSKERDALHEDYYRYHKMDK